MHTRQVTVTDNHGIGILIDKRLQQIEHRQLLRLCARVSRLAVDVKTALIAHAYAVGVEYATAMRSCITYGSPLLHYAIATYDIVITYALIAHLPVPLVYLPGRGGLVGTNGRAVDDY